MFHLLFCFLVIAVAGVLPFLYNRISHLFVSSELSSKRSAYILFFAIIIGFYSNPLVEGSKYLPQETGILSYSIQFAIKAAYASVLFCFFSFITSLLSTKKLGLFPVNNHKTCLTISLFSAISMLILWYCMGTHASFDFHVRQMNQITTGEYEKAHPIIHTIFCKFLLDIYNSYKTIVIAQIVLFTIGVYAMCWWCMRAKLSFLYASITVVAIIFLTYPYIHIIIKDSFFISSYMIALAGLMAWSLRPDNAATFVSAFGLTCVGLFRYDGQGAVILTAIALIILCIATRKNIRKILVMVLIPTLSIFLAHSVLPICVNAKSEMVGTKLAMPAELICEVIAQNGNLTPEEITRVEELIMPRKMILEHHKKGEAYEGQKYIWGGYFRSESEFRKYSFAFNLSGKGHEIIPLFFKIAAKNPGIVIDHLLMQSKMLWDVAYNRISSTSLAFYLYIFTLISILERKSLRPFSIPFVPTFSVILTCSLIATTFELRYGLPIIVGSIFMIGYTNRVRTLHLT